MHNLIKNTCGSRVMSIFAKKILTGQNNARQTLVIVLHTRVAGQYKMNKYAQFESNIP